MNYSDNIYVKDFILQSNVQQSSFFTKYHPSSLNTLRIMTFKHNNNIELISSVASFRNGGSNVDNQATGGVSCGISIDEN